jgi:AAA15 family ATPase/GTPase
MLVRFSVENFLSFRDRTELSMVASGKVRRHPEHVIKPSTAAGIPLLKLAIIYGANASGKSNLVKAMAMAKQIILHPAEAGGRIVQNPFKLDPACRHRPTRFEFEIKAGDRYFAYGFSYRPERIEEEWLFEVTRTSENRIFERSRGKIELGELSFANGNEEQFLKFTAKGTLQNRLFLTECRERNVRENVTGAEDILKVLDWIEESLVSVLPASELQLRPFGIFTNGAFIKDLARYLNCFDTGIDEVDIERVEPGSANVPMEMWKRLEAESPLGFALPEGAHILFDRDDKGKLRAWKLIARHRTRSGAKNISTFDMTEESDGTRRLMYLVPAMIALMGSDSVFLIDELDRSLHPEILHSYLANYLKYSAGQSSQLIVTTHDTTLLKQSFVRRDEVWFMEKGDDQSSRLIALEEFKNADRSKDLQQDYLMGRFGGVPVIRDFSWLGEDHGKGT